jgi:hypothetical protein
MYAQLIEGGTTPESRTEMDRIVTDEMIPALKAEPGFSGALNIVDRSSGNAMMLVLWETEAQARRALSEYGDAFLRRWLASPRSRPARAARSRCGRSTRGRRRRDDTYPSRQGECGGSPASLRGSADQRRHRPGLAARPPDGRLPPDPAALRRGEARHRRRARGRSARRSRRRARRRRAAGRVRTGAARPRRGGGPRRARRRAVRAGAPRRGAAPPAGGRSSRGASCITARPRACSRRCATAGRRSSACTASASSTT